MTSEKLAIIYLVITSFLYVLFGVAIRLIDHAMTPALGVVTRLALGAVLYYIIFRKQINITEIKQINRNDLINIIIMGILGYSVYILLVSYGTLSTTLFGVSIALGTAPLWTYLLSLIFLNYKISLKMGIYVLVAFLGIMLVASSDIAGLKNLQMLSDRGFMLITIAAGLGAIYAILRNKISDTLNNHEISFLVLAVAALGSIILTFTEENVIIYENIISIRFLSGVILGACLNMVVLYLSNYAFKNINVVLGEQLLLLENVFAIAIGYLFYHEVINLYQMIGAILIVASAYFSSKHQLKASE